VNLSTRCSTERFRVGFLDTGRRIYVPPDEAAEIRFKGVGPTMARLFEKVPASPSHSFWPVRRSRVFS